MNPPTRRQQLENSALALCDVLPPAYAGQVLTLTNAIADRAANASAFGGSAQSVNYANCAIDSLTALLEEISEALTTRARVA